MFPAGRVEISVDGGDVHRHRARTVVVGNVGYLQAGHAAASRRRDRRRPPRVVCSTRVAFVSWIPLAWRVLLKRKRTDDPVNRMTGRTSSSALPGHPPPARRRLGRPGRELPMQCVHGRLLVRVPR